MPDNCISTDRSFLYKKMQPGQGTRSLWIISLNEQAAHAHVPNPRDFLPYVAMPVDPHISGCRYAGRHSPGWGSFGSQWGVSEYHGLRDHRPIQHAQAI